MITPTAPPRTERLRRSAGARLAQGTAHALGAALLALATTGCETLNLPPLAGNATPEGYPTVSNAVTQACAGGAVLGIAYAQLKGGERPEKAHERILETVRDTAAGLAIGCTVGYALDLRRQRSGTDADFLDKEIAITQNANRELSRVNSHLQSRTAANRAELERLERQREAATLSGEAARRARDTARADLDWARSQLHTAEQNLESQRSALDTPASRTDTARGAQLAEEVASLESYVASLEREVSELASVNDSIGQFRG